MPRQSTVDGISVWEWPGTRLEALLMHGIGNYGRYWDFFAEEINERMRLVAPDARGHGDSHKPARGYMPKDFIADALRVMDATQLERPVVVGHSMGGFHATAVTLAHPERVRALVLVDAGPRVEMEGASRARRLSLERPDRFADDAAALAYLRETSPGYSDAVFANRMEWVFRREGSDLVWKSSKDALRQIFDESTRHSADWSVLLGAIRVPVLIVRGTRSSSFSDKTARSMLKKLKHARLVELDAGHNVPLDRPRELARAVLDFGREVYARAIG